MSAFGRCISALFPASRRHVITPPGSGTKGCGAPPRLAALPRRGLGGLPRRTARFRPALAFEAGHGTDAYALPPRRAPEHVHVGATRKCAVTRRAPAARLPFARQKAGGKPPAPPPPRPAFVLPAGMVHAATPGPHCRPRPARMFAKGWGLDSRRVKAAVSSRHGTAGDGDDRQGMESHPRHVGWLSPLGRP